ncbi:MAG TPA: XRE family transcriptional regulator [Gemmatimonadaceae bacterium]
MIDDPIPALKDQLGRSILAEIGPMNQLAAARMLGLDEARISNIEHGRLERFSLQKLVRLLVQRVKCVAAIAANFAIVFILRAVPFLAAGIFSFERPMFAP